MDRRISYERDALDEALVDADPIVQFLAWFETAKGAEREPAAMVLATVGGDGAPASRIVLLRACDHHGFVFYTNYESRKGRELEGAPGAALLFFWAGLERQVRIEGRAARVSAAESDAYFAQRPRGHQLAAWASPQSRVVRDRAALDADMVAAEQRFAGVKVERPPFWGGYRVTPMRLEFWQGRPNRVHDRIAYSRVGETWRIERLSP